MWNPRWKNPKKAASSLAAGGVSWEDVIAPLKLMSWFPGGGMTMSGARDVLCFAASNWGKHVGLRVLFYLFSGGTVWCCLRPFWLKGCF